MKVLLSEEWKVNRKPYHGMVKLMNRNERMYLIIDSVKIYSKTRNLSFIYTVKAGKVLKLTTEAYAKMIRECINAKHEIE